MKITDETYLCAYFYAHMIAAALAAAFICTMLFSGCGTIATHLDISRGRMLQGAHLTTGEPALAFNPFGLLPQTAGEWTEQCAGIGADIAAGIAGYQLYKKAHDSTSGDTTASVPPPAPNAPTIYISGNGNTVHTGRRH